MYLGSFGLGIFLLGYGGVVCRVVALFVFGVFVVVVVFFVVVVFVVLCLRIVVLSTVLGLKILLKKSDQPSDQTSETKSILQYETLNRTNKSCHSPTVPTPRILCGCIPRIGNSNAAPGVGKWRRQGERRQTRRTKTTTKAHTITQKRAKTNNNEQQPITTNNNE